MSDIFISYARSTEPQAQKIEDALRALGYEVWRDDQIPAHQAFGKFLEERLTAAKAVLVLWSAEAADSEWVRSEASRARTMGKLVQLTLDRSPLPMPFDQIQCADLAGWGGESVHAGWRKIVSSVGDLAGPGAAKSGAPAAPAPTPAQRRDVETDNLPRRLSSLFGRQAEVEQIEALLSRSGLVTITGLGGVGKTRLAIEVAQRTVGQYEDGAWLVELAPVSEAELVAGAIARALAIDLPVGQQPLDALIERLRLRQCLIVLDNCEHVIDAAAAFAEAILDASRGVRVLASSQELLGVEGEQVFRLRSLDEADAAALFAERATAADAGFAVNERDTAAVKAICRRLDGIPLAIEMAAARAPSLGCDGVLRRLDDRFRLLTGGRRTALPRQRTLAATLDWSHGLLSERDATVFRRLGVFSGGFTLEAASAVAADDGLDGFEVVDAVSSLVAKSLVSADPGAERPRYRLLETGRAYALEKLDAAGETPAFQRRHAEWVLEFVRPSGDDFGSHMDDESFADRYFGENDNLERALDWTFGPSGDDTLGVTLVAHSSGVFNCQSLYSDYLRWLDIAAPRLDGDIPQPVRARFLLSLASSFMMSLPGRALEMVDDAIAACRADGDPTALAAALNAKGVTLYMAGRITEAGELVAESMRLIASLPTGRTPSQSKLLSGLLRLQSDGAEAAMPLFNEAISDLRAFGAHGLANWFDCNRSTAVPPPDSEAVGVWRDILARIRPREILADLTSSVATSQLISALARRAGPGDAEEAIETYRGAFKRIDRGLSRVSILLSMGLVAVAQGRLHDGALLAGRIDVIISDIGGAEILNLQRYELRDQLRAKLPPETLDALLAEGARLTDDEALLLAAGPPPAVSSDHR